MIDHLGTVGYLAARAGIKGVNAPDFPDPLREEFDVYNDENSIYYPQFSDVNKAYVDDAIAKGGWAIREAARHRKYDVGSHPHGRLPGSPRPRQRQGRQ